MSRRVGMADEADSKSVVGNHVWVQVPLPALKKWLILIRYPATFFIELRRPGAGSMLLFIIGASLTSLNIFESNIIELL